MTGRRRSKNTANGLNEDQDPSALEDLHAGRQFYDRPGEGVDEYFFDALITAIDLLPLYAGIHPKISGYHRLLAKGFPPAIYYKMEDTKTVVGQRVLHLGQHPPKIRSALP